jgi:hypothetical protein
MYSAFKSVENVLIIFQFCTFSELQNDAFYISQCCTRAVEDYICENCIFCKYLKDRGLGGSVVVKALRYKSDGLGIDSPWCHWGFFP